MGEPKVTFSKPNIALCDGCRVIKRKNKNANKKALAQICPKGEVHCFECGECCSVELFQRNYRHHVTGKIKKITCGTCVVCLDKCYNSRTRSERQQFLKDKREEKLERLMCREDGINGCCKDCPFDIEEIRRVFREILGQEKGDDVYFELLEWDHIKLYEAYLLVSNIHNKELRRKELLNCQLRCILCHRYKTVKNADTVPNVDGLRGEGEKDVAELKDMEKITAYLDLKTEWLAKNADGCCPGYEDGKECPFQKHLIPLKLVESDLLANNHELLAHDFDHRV